MRQINSYVSSVGVRLPAEWEKQGAVLLSWPHSGTDWAYMLEEVRTCFTQIANAIARHARLVIVGEELDDAKRRLAHLTESQVAYIPCPTNDTWARDFGPISTVNALGEWTINDFRFNGWGMKFAAGKDNLVTRRLISCGFFQEDWHCCREGFVLEGGSIECDGKGLLLTTTQCLLSDNRNDEMDKDDIEAYLCEALGVEKILWLDHGYMAGDDTDSHIDTLARLAPGNIIIYQGCNDCNDEHFEEINKMKRQLAEMTSIEGDPFSLVEFPRPVRIYDEDGLRLPATYANFLILNNAVLFPVYGQKENDKVSIGIIQSVFPDHEIIPIDCRPLIRQHGSLHCVTMQLPEAIIPNKFNQ